MSIRLHLVQSGHQTDSLYDLQENRPDESLLERVYLMSKHLREVLSRLCAPSSICLHTKTH